MKKTAVVFGVCVAIFLVAYIFLQKNNQLTLHVSEPPEVTEVSLYHYFSGSLSGGLGEMVEKINKNNQAQQLVAHPLDHEAFKTMIHTTLETGNPPELFSYWAGARTQALVDRGQLQPFDDELWTGIQGKDRFSEAIVEAATTYNGKKYLLPITQHFVVFFYYKKVFADSDIEVPVSWNEFLELCQTLKEGGMPAVALGARERWPAQFWFDYLLLRTAGTEYRASLMQGKQSYTDQKVISAYKIWAQMLSQGFFNQDANTIDWAEATELVCRGDAAMTLMGTWAIPVLSGKTCNLREGDDFDYFTFPVIDEKIPSSSVGPIDGIVLTRESSQHELAKTALAYFAKTDLQQILSTGSGALSPSQDVPEAFYSPFKQKLLHDLRNSPSWAFNYDLATSPLIAEKGMDSFNELIAFPGQYLEILRNIQQEVEKIVSESSSIYSEPKNTSP